MEPALSVREVLSGKRKGMSILSGDPALDKALWDIAEVLKEIAEKSPASKADQREGSIINTEESDTDARE